MGYNRLDIKKGGQEKRSNLGNKSTQVNNQMHYLKEKENENE